MAVLADRDTLIQRFVSLCAIAVGEKNVMLRFIIEPG